MGTGDSLARLPPIDENLRDRFKQHVESEWNGIKGHYRMEVERALREYLNASNGGDTHDRLRRLESKVDAIDDRTQAIASDGQRKKKKDSDVSATTAKRLDQIEGIIEREAGTGTVHEAVVRKAIEDVAGHSDPTIRRYRQMLTDRRVLYGHPKRANSYVYGEREFVEMTQSLRKNGAIGRERYWSLVDDFGGEEIYRDALERYEVGDDKDDRRGFA